MEIWVIVTGTAVLLLMLWGLVRLTQRDMQSPDEVLEEAEIYRSYGRLKEAALVLKRGLARFPHSQALKDKLAEFEQ